MAAIMASRGLARFRVLELQIGLKAAPRYRYMHIYQGRGDLARKIIDRAFHAHVVGHQVIGEARSRNRDRSRRCVG